VPFGSFYQCCSNLSLANCGAGVGLITIGHGIQSSEFVVWPGIADGWDFALTGQLSLTGSVLSWCQVGKCLLLS
jgi:hypothetical protein